MLCFVTQAFGYTTALDIRKLKQLLYELLYEFEFHRLSQTFTSYERLVEDLVYSIFLPKFICTVNPLGQYRPV